MNLKLSFKIDFCNKSTGWRLKNSNARHFLHLKINQLDSSLFPPSTFSFFRLATGSSLPEFRQKLLFGGSLIWKLNRQFFTYELWKYFMLARTWIIYNEVDGITRPIYAVNALRMYTSMYACNVFLELAVMHRKIKFIKLHRLQKSLII